MSYIGKDNITVFPSARRSYVPTSHPEAGSKFTSENNLTSILRSICDKDSYIINWSTSAEIVIHGYYFNIADTSSLPSGILYAHITLDSTNKELVATDGTASLDDNTNFIGLSFDSDESPVAPTGCEVYTLQIKDAVSVVEANKAQFSLNRLFSKNNETLPVSFGGTGANNLDNITVGKAKKLNAAAGDSTHPVYVASDGTVTAISKVAEASSSDQATKVTGKIGNSNISDIFETNGTTVKNATRATTSGSVDSVGWSSVTNKPNFATVATSGSYNDLSNKPTIPTIPSNNVTGSGTSGYIAKWNGTNSITKGPAFDTGVTTTYLRRDGNWATPQNTTYTIDTNGNNVRLKDQNNNVVSSITPTYAAEAAKLTTQSAGSGYANGVEQTCYFSNGQPQAGFRVFIDSNQPSNATLGDIWIKI